MSTKRVDAGRITRKAEEADGASAHSGPQSPQAAPPTDSKPPMPGVARPRGRPSRSLGSVGLRVR